MDLLAVIRGRWDVAILANLAKDSSRPTDLLDAINAQAPDGHHLTWKVMLERLRRLEEAGYVDRREVRKFPRETHYWATAFACQLLDQLDLLDSWYEKNGPENRPAFRQDAGEEFPASGADETDRSSPTWLAS